MVSHEAHNLKTAVRIRPPQHVYKNPILVIGFLYWKMWMNEHHKSISIL